MNTMSNEYFQRKIYCDAYQAALSMGVPRVEAQDAAHNAVEDFKNEFPEQKDS